MLHQLRKIYLINFNLNQLRRKFKFLWRDIASKFDIREFYTNPVNVCFFQIKFYYVLFNDPYQE